MSNLTEQAIRRNLHPDQELRTLSHDSKFLVAELADDALVLALQLPDKTSRHGFVRGLHPSRVASLQGVLASEFAEGIPHTV